MKEKITALFMAGTVALLGLTPVFAEDNSARIAEIEAQIAELQAELNELRADESSVSSETDSSDVLEYHEGMYKVGTDMQAGVYFLKPDSSDREGYITVSNDANKNDIIYIESFSGNLIAEVRDGEYVELTRTTATTYTQKEQINYDADDFELEIGVHIPAGEYKLEPTSNDRDGYYTIYSDNRFDNIVAIDSYSTNGYVSVEDGQFLVISRGRIVQ